SSDLAVMLLVAGFVFAAGSQAPVAAYSDGWISTDVLNLREDAGTWAPVIDQMWDGEYVGVLDGPTSDGWYLVEYQGSVGWAFGAYLSVNGASGWGGESGGGERWADVNRSTGVVTLYAGNTPIESYGGAAFGWDASSSGFYSTAIGTYYVYSKNAGLAWTDWGQVYIKYWVGFDPQRYNGFHSYSLDANGNVLPNGDGATGGCVALPLWSAEIVYDWLTIGSRVEVHW
ncbi:MAG: SH3 domain-containing protein, partial [Thermomicrobiales bacterium]